MKDGSVIGSNIKVADNFIHRLIGLMGKKCLLHGEGLLLKGCRQIHTFFMFMTIDVVFLDRSGEVVDIQKAMTPCKVSPYVKKAYQVLELPQGTIEQYAIQKKVMLKVGRVDIP
ncbi:MAG: hypothetical protein CVU87_01415 [Firmicutes bacterium HGW-Firmicutes-12]|jgi:hypothetical protein|nr:MAG: hypothetical protein CVU87_01415 [Firmicutes bacterium HGW-Firmicutes-12]